MASPSDKKATAIEKIVVIFTDLKRREHTMPWEAPGSVRRQSDRKTRA